MLATTWKTTPSSSTLKEYGVHAFFFFALVVWISSKKKNNEKRRRHIRFVLSPSSVGFRVVFPIRSHV